MGLLKQASQASWLWPGHHQRVALSFWLEETGRHSQLPQPIKLDNSEVWCMSLKSPQKDGIPFSICSPIQLGFSPPFPSPLFPSPPLAFPGWYQIPGLQGASYVTLPQEETTGIHHFTLWLQSAGNGASCKPDSALSWSYILSPKIVTFYDRVPISTREYCWL